MALLTKQMLLTHADKSGAKVRSEALTSNQTAIQRALLEQTQQYIAQYTPNPRIMSYATDENGNVMGKFTSQNRVFTFRMANNRLVYKPFAPRTDSESEQEYTARLDSLSAMYLEKFDDYENNYRNDAAKAYKPKLSVPKKKRGTKQNPVCGVTSYHCGVCISLGKNCIKNANTEALKERFSKIKSLAKMAHESGVLPQVKTGAIGAKTDPKSLMKKAQGQARDLAENEKTTTLQTPLPLTANSQKRLERGESISDNETYHVKKEGNKYRVTNPNKFEDEGKLVDKAGLSAHMKELEAQPKAVKKSSSMSPVIPINGNPDTMLRALRDGRLIGDKKQGYEIQEHPTQKGDYLVTTMPNKEGNYSGVMSRKELVSFVKSGGDGSRFSKGAQKKGTVTPYEVAAKTPKGGVANSNYDQKQANNADLITAIGNGLPNKPKMIYDWAQKNGVDLNELLSKHGKGLTPQAAKKDSPEHLALLDAVWNDKPFSLGKKPSDYIPLTSDKNLSKPRKKQQRSTDQITSDRTKDDVRRASQSINKLDESIKKIKAGNGVMSEKDLKKLASLEAQKADWVARRDKLTGKDKPEIQGKGDTEAERRQFLLNTNTQSSAKPIEPKPIEPKREIELADVKTPQDHIKYATQELNIAKASKDTERINKWINELQRAKKRQMSSLTSANNTHQPDLFFVNKGNPNQKSIFDSVKFDAEYDESIERNILTNIGLMLSRAISGNQTSPTTVQLRKVKFDGSNFSGIFTQYGEQFDFDITNKGVVISPVRVRQDRIAGVAYAKTKTVGMGRKCGRGYKCKGTCISKSNKCRVDWASKEGLAQFKSMQAELKSLTSPKFIEINGRQVVEQRSPEGDAKTLALAKHLATARQSRKEHGEQHKEQTKKFYSKVNAEVEKRLKESGLNANKVKSTLGELDPKDLAVDPKRFQYKITGEHTASGTVGSLQGVNKWDENLAGILQVWKDPEDGKTYVVNGHNRLSKANELGADKVAVRYLDVPSAKEARTIGAMTNIAEGHGTALDAAKFFRDTNWTKEDLVKKGIPLKEKIATDGLAIASLEPNLFRQVIDGELPMERASIIGGNGLSHEKQKSLMDLLAKRKTINNSVLSELIDTVKYSGQKQEEQFDLFGNNTATVDLAVHRASLQSHIKQKLASEKKLFGTVSKSKSAKDLERGGNVIDANKSGEIASQADTALKIFDTIKHHVGGVSDALNSAAERFADAKTKAEKEKINRETYETVLKAIQLENDKLKPKRDSLLAGRKGSDFGQRVNSSGFRRQPTEKTMKRTDQAFSETDQILTYITDKSGNMMGVLQLGGVKYRFLKPVFGIVTLVPVTDTNLSYLFDQAPDLTLPQGDLLDQVVTGCNHDSTKLKKKEHDDSFLENLHPRYPKGHPNAGKFMSKKDMALAARNFASKNKGKIATEGAVVAAGVVGSAVGSPVVGALASASMRSAITIGKKIKASTVKVKSEHVKNARIGANALSKVSDKLGASSISELASPKFQRQLERAFIGDLAFGAVDMAVSALIPLPAVGSAVALKTSGAVGRFADRVVQSIKKQRKTQETT